MIAGGYAAATFGIGMMALPSTHAGIVVAGAASGLGGGMMERSVEGVLHHGLEAPGTEEPDWTSQSFAADAGGGIAGAYAGRGVSKLVRKLDWDKRLYRVVEETVGQFFDKAVEELITWALDYEWGYDYGYHGYFDYYDAYRVYHGYEP